MAFRPRLDGRPRAHQPRTSARVRPDAGSGRSRPRRDHALGVHQRDALVSRTMAADLDEHLTLPWGETSQLSLQASDAKNDEENPMTAQLSLDPVIDAHI